MGGLEVLMMMMDVAEIELGEIFASSHLHILSLRSVIPRTTKTLTVGRRRRRWLAGYFRRVNLYLRPNQLVRR